jgi:hypothetical protein
MKIFLQALMMILLTEMKATRCAGFEYLTAKTKLAIEILNALSKQAVEEYLFTKELIKSRKFSKEEAGFISLSGS